MGNGILLPYIRFISHVLLVGGGIVRVMLRPHREPTSRVAWIVVILSLPGIGILAYLFLGETNIGHRRIERMRKVIVMLPDTDRTGGLEVAERIRSAVAKKRFKVYDIAFKFFGNKL